MEQRTPTSTPKLSWWQDLGVGGKPGHEGPELHRRQPPHRIPPDGVKLPNPEIETGRVAASALPDLA